MADHEIEVKWKYLDKDKCKGKIQESVVVKTEGLLLSKKRLKEGDDVCNGSLPMMCFEFFNWF